MKTVLIIASFWPYRQGSRRTSLIQYLPEFGWKSIILTPKLESKPAPSFQVVETSYTSVLGSWGKILRLDSDAESSSQFKEPLGTKTKRPFIAPLLHFGGAVLNYPDAYKRWKAPAIQAGNRLMSNQPIDAILSIWPVTAHLVARELVSRFKVGWVADYPDLWSQNANYAYGYLRRRLDRRLELKTMACADALTTVSEPLAEALRTLHNGKPVYAITHGFDPAEVNTPPAKLTPKFTITYTGSIYRGRQDTTRLFTALGDLVAGGTINPAEVEVRFFGPVLEWLDQEAERYGLTGIIRQYGVVPHHSAMEKQKESQLLLLLDWEDAKEKGVYTGKIFEYLGSQRPILATGGSSGNVVDLLLRETRAGIHALTAEDIKNTVKHLYREYKDSGAVLYQGEKLKVDKYSQREMARQFAEIFDRLTGTISVT